MSESKLILPKEVMERLKISRHTLYRWAERGMLEPISLPNGHHRYRVVDIEAIERGEGVRHG